MVKNKISKIISYVLVSAVTMIPVTANAKTIETLHKADFDNGKAVMCQYQNVMGDQATHYSPAIKRLAGDDRIGTAIDIAREKNQQGGTIVIVNGYKFENALAGSAFYTQHNNATILLTDIDSLDSRNITEIQRRKPSNIFILGGTDEVSTSIENSLKSLCSTVSRISGADIYKSAVAIGQNVIGTSNADTVFLTCDNYADALAASTFSAKKGYPILYTGSESLNLDSQQAIQTWGIKNVVILGGTGVVSDEVEQQLKDMNLIVTRLGGANRYETAQLILNKYYDSSCVGLTVCTGENFPDSLAGVSLAAEKNMPVMLYTGYVTSDITDFIKPKFTKGYILGGEGVEPSSAIANLEPAAPTSGLTATVLNSGYSPYSENTVTQSTQWKVKFSKPVNLKDLKFYALGTSNDLNLDTRAITYNTFFTQIEYNIMAEQIDANTVVFKHVDDNYDVIYNVLDTIPNGRYGLVINKDTKSTTGDNLNNDFYIWYQVKDSTEPDSMPFDIY